MAAAHGECMLFLPMPTLAPTPMSFCLWETSCGSFNDARSRDASKQEAEIRSKRPTDSEESPVPKLELASNSDCCLYISGVYSLRINCWRAGLFQPHHMFYGCDWLRCFEGQAGIRCSWESSRVKWAVLYGRTPYYYLTTPLPHIVPLDMCLSLAWW